jgi:hypothetical protein
LLGRFVESKLLILRHLNDANHVGETCAARENFISHLLQVIPLPFRDDSDPASGLVFFADTPSYHRALEGIAGLVAFCQSFFPNPLFEFNIER